MEIAHPQKTIQVFLALCVDVQYHKAITRLQSELKMDLDSLPHSIRWTQPKRLHLTLFFLGRHFVDDINRLINHMKKMNFSDITIPELHCNQIQLFPEHKPTVVALTGPPSFSLIHLREKIKKCIEQAQIEPNYTHEKQGFLPHITLGRLEEPTDLKTQPADVQLHFSHLVLFQSEGIEPPRSPYVKHTPLYQYFFNE